MGELCAVGDVDDERVPMGALFGYENLLDCGGREGVCAEAVDGFGGESNETPEAQDFDCASDIGGFSGLEALGLAGCGHEIILSFW